MSPVSFWIAGLLAASPPEGAPSAPADQLTIPGRSPVAREAEVPFAHSVLETPDVRRGRATLSLGESLNAVPGVFVTSRRNFAQDTRLSVRGYGARSPFGIRGIRVYLDGIPLTFADGQTQLDTLDLAHVGRIEVRRGPAASLYGNGSGAVLWLESPRAPQGPTVEAFGLAAPFETFKLAATAAHGLDTGEVQAFASHTNTAGYRPDSSAEQTVAQAHGRLQLLPGLRLRWVTHFVHAPRAQDPGGLTERQWRSDPRQAAEVNQRFGAGESVTQLQAGSGFDVRWAQDHHLELTVHGGVRDFQNALPFRTVAFTRTFYGVMGLYGWKGPFHHLWVGAEGQFFRDRRDERGNQDGRPAGALRLDQEEQVRSVGAFVRNQLRLGSRWVVDAGLRIDHVGFRVEDFLNQGSGGRDFGQLTGQGGLLFRPTSEVEVFANLSQSFQTPTSTELVASAETGVGLSQSLEPERSLSPELGVRFETAVLQAEATFFLIHLQDELLPREDGDGVTRFFNADSSHRFGFESLLRYTPIRPLELLLSTTWLRARTRGVNGQTFVTPGLPTHRVFGRVQWTQGRLHLAAEAEYVASRFADDENRVRAPDHALLEARAGIRFLSTDDWSGDFTVGFHNLLDASYVDNVRINAFGERFFEPGLPFGGFATFELSHRIKTPTDSPRSARIHEKSHPHFGSAAHPLERVRSPGPTRYPDPADR